MTCTGWVKRAKDSADRRVSRVYLTAEGRALQGPVQETWQTLEKLTMVNFSVEERVLLRRFLNQLVENLDG